MIPEREREALIRLTMCAREECGMCKYKDACNFDFQYETATRCMNILADALRKTEPQRGCDADCNEGCNECAKETELWRAEQTEPTGYNLSPVEDKTQTVKCFSCTHSKKPNTVEPCKSCEDFNNYEPQTDCDDRYALKTDSGEVVAYACPLGCEQTDCPWR